VLGYPGVTLHPHVIRSVLVRTPQIADYQVRQTESGIDLDILDAGPPGSAEPIPADDLTRRLTAALGRVGLGDPQVHVRVVSDLTRQQQSGKLSRFVPLPGR
jgi:phenylacetate-CoA ligase